MSVVRLAAGKLNSGATSPACVEDSVPHATAKNVRRTTDAKTRRSGSGTEIRRAESNGFSFGAWSALAR